MQAYLKKQEKSQINNLTLHLKQLEKEEMENPRVSRRKEILKIRAEIHAKETKETIAKINKAKSWFFERINKIDKPLDRLIKKQREKKKSQINNLTVHLKQPEKEEMKNPRVSRRKEILKIRAEINAKEPKETRAKISKAKSWFFKRINKIDKPLARLIKKQGEKNQINKNRNENGEITTDNTEMQRNKSPWQKSRKANAGSLKG